MSSDKPTPKEKRRPEDWTPEQKLLAVAEASRLTDAELGEWLRRQGLHQSHVDEWRKSALEALGVGAKPSRPSPDARRVRELEKELTRKDKALAETAALLVLQKKARAIWGDADDDTERGTDE